MTPNLPNSDPNSDRTILLLDDDATTLYVLRTILERTAARVLECGSKFSALRKGEELLKSIDLLVADVVLEDGSGPQVARKIKELQPLIRLLYISGYSITELQRRGLLSTGEISPGSVEFLQKPFSRDQFLDSVERLLPNKRNTASQSL